MMSCDDCRRFWDVRNDIGAATSATWAELQKSTPNLPDMVLNIPRTFKNQKELFEPDPI